MLYGNFTVTIGQRQEAGYPVSAIADGVGRVSTVLSRPDHHLEPLLARVAELRPGSQDEAILRSTGEAMFRWLMRGDLEMLLRIARDRADRWGRGLRFRLSIDAPEVNAWPWELLYDPERDHRFAITISTLLVRFLDQASHFGGLADQEAHLPLGLILVIPSAPTLDLAHEKSVIQQATSPLGDLLKLRVLDGKVTRPVLSDALLAGHYDIAHFSGHGGYAEGEGYIGLSDTEKGVDWVDGPALSQLLANHPSFKLVVLNACSSGRVDACRAFRGLAPELVRQGIPAVVAMRFPLTDRASATFAREFYRQLCAGENAGQIDVAVTHARNMLAVLLPGDPSWAAPVLYMHSADGAIFALPHEGGQQAGLHSDEQQGHQAALISSLQASMDYDEDWAMADQAELDKWRDVLEQTKLVYRRHLASADAGTQEAAYYGLALIRARLASLERALATVKQ
jgi:hypothetical protein